MEKKLVKQNHNVVVTQEPGGTSFGKHVVEIFKNERTKLCTQAEYLLFASDRAQHFQKIIIPALKKKSIVLSDRMADSSIAYQGYGHNVDITMIKKINSWVMHAITPSLVFYLQLSLSEAKNRILKRKKQLTSFEKKEEAYWKRVIDGYELIFKNRDDVCILDAQRSPEKLVKKAFDALNTLLL